MTGPADSRAPGRAGAVLSAAGPIGARVRPRLFLLAFAVAASAVLIDQGTKALALARLSEQARIPLLGDLLGLQLAFNPGTVMSLGSGSTWLITLIAAAASVPCV